MSRAEAVPAFPALLVSGRQRRDPPSVDSASGTPHGDPPCRPCPASGRPATSWPTADTNMPAPPSTRGTSRRRPISRARRWNSPLASPPAHALLGRAEAASARAEAAVAALREALALEPDDALGVRLDLARLGAIAPEAAITDGYVRALFDDYAPQFERHLVEESLLSRSRPPGRRPPPRRRPAHAGLPLSGSARSRLRHRA